VEQLEEWRKWQKREEKVQGVIRTTVSNGIVIDILDMNSAKQMGDYIQATHQLDSPEEQAQVGDALATIRLKEDPSAEEMEIHLERFKSLLLRARTASLKIDEAERVERFLATLPKALAVLRLQFRLADRSGKHGLKSQNNTTLKQPIESVQQEQETEQVLLCCQGLRRKAKYQTSARGMQHMKSAGTVTRQDTSLETAGHSRMMQITRSSSGLSQGFEGPSQRAISEKMRSGMKNMA
jgi:hypothetical protein